MEAACDERRTHLKRDAPRVATAARQCAWPRSAASLGATLTPDDVAMARASAAVVRLDAMIETMRRDGTLREFNARYKAGRAAAAAEGRGYMNFARARASVALKLPGAMQLMHVPMIAGASNMVRPSFCLCSRWPQTAGVNPLSFVGSD